MREGSARAGARARQVHAFMTGDAVAGVVTGALGSLGTPDLLLQTDLTQVLTIGISPAALPPALLYEGSFGVAATQTLTLSNGANTSVAFNVLGAPAAEAGLAGCADCPGSMRLRGARRTGEHHAEGRIWRLAVGRAGVGCRGARRGGRGAAQLRHQPERVPGRQHGGRAAHDHRAPAGQGAPWACRLSLTLIHAAGGRLRAAGALSGAPGARRLTRARRAGHDGQRVHLLPGAEWRASRRRAQHHRPVLHAGAGHAADDRRLAAGAGRRAARLRRAGHPARLPAEQG